MKQFFLLSIILIALTIVLTACGEKVEPECAVDNDCTAIGTCGVARCVEGMCQQTTKQNCCGNNICEEKAKENVCSCDEDCDFEGTEDGTCSGKVRIPNPYIQGQYNSVKNAVYYCENDECVAGIPESEIQEEQLFFQTRGGVEFEVLTTISQPFIVGDGTFKIKVRLINLQYQARAPVTITGFKVLAGSELMAEKVFQKKLTAVGQTHEEILHLKPTLDAVEEERFVTVKINYEFNNENPVNGDLTLQRTNIENRFPQIVFIDPKQAPN